MKHTKFKPTKLAASLSLLLGASAAFAAHSADTVLPADDTEVIQVTGIRSSQAKAMDTKRSSSGVVDAISAEDIGKFPDTNLAESLQRITGVSISRENGEGSQVTVRGFGPDYNLVLFNNRVMPTAQASGSSTRSFDFANIASESVSGIEVSKTGRANVASGGIGSTINITTARPFDTDELVASISAKAHHDTSVDSSVDGAGDDITPELSAIFSDTYLDKTFGLGLTASYKERNTTINAATIDGWRQFNEEDTEFQQLMTNVENGTATLVDENENPYGNYFYARNVGYSTTDVERKRFNAQLVAQWAPNDNIEVTTDYTYSKLEDESYVDSWGLWFSGLGNITNAHVNENGTFDYATEVDGDYSSTMTTNATENINKSLGLNIKWQVNDDLELEFDAHDSNAISRGTDDGASSTFFILGGLNVTDKTYDATSGDIPILSATFTEESDDGIHLQPEHYASLFTGVVAGRNDTDVTQAQLNGSYFVDMPDVLDSIDFGIAYVNMETRALGSYAQYSAGWYSETGIWEDDLELVQLDNGFLGDFSGGGNDMAIPYYYTYDQAAAMAKAEERYGETYAAGDWTDDHTIEEETKSIYVQFNTETEIAEMPFNVTLGARYEQTDVTASSLQQEAESVVWMSATEWYTETASEFTYSHETHDYSEFLPNLDLQLEIVDDLIARVSLSKTLTRPTLSDMKATTSLTSQPKVGSRTGSAGNPALKPFSADNIDLSLEYYYDEASYVSVGWFNKDVENFTMTTTTYETYDHLRDPYYSAGADEARAAAAADGVTASDEYIFNYLVDNGYANSEGFIEQSDDDPVITWAISTPKNVEDLNVHGWEIAWQHWLWDTGFGFAANATLVSGDTEYDVENTEEQFALPGLSDSANFSVFYEKFGWQARLAYNWRDEFLSATGQAEAGGPAPQFTEAYGQLDMSLSYEFDENLSVFFEGINILEEDMRIHGRYDEQLIRAQQNDARYAIGARYAF
ncbi:TonB-dependent receptor [Neiella marina]|uniref:TonB-dependent receptor n=1 Tax=Neiella holothuriorum TaxID=2870530 RepID=A0ABS7EFB6_9GAMM|nr:TonB-dependent receptor [Neiella holothuriorum]MBW8190904.1 TonB-dependent receptor [Neiella holothuriorum]